MPLSPGEKLGQFDVLSLLGKGGMGEVYRALDTQLKREVALKVLPAAFSSNPERLARFQREAELLASLDHPNIGHIYGMVQSEQNWALVLALIEGPTLDDRIKQGPLLADEAIAISKQIIDALEYAHEHGVIHRDLKPANIKVTPDGVVKVLDFGLAKALDQRAATSLDLENSPTLTMGATQAGVIMGTAAYMSPEQAVGKAADRRSDIFSFGVVLYEMLAGKRPFRGESMGDTLAAVVKDTPDWSALPAEVPSHLRKLLGRTLAKDRKLRLQAIGEARIALAQPAEHESSTPRALPVQRRHALLPWAIATFVLLALIPVNVLHLPGNSAAAARPQHDTAASRKRRVRHQQPLLIARHLSGRNPHRLRSQNEGRPDAALVAPPGLGDGTAAARHGGCGAAFLVSGQPGHPTQGRLTHVRWLRTLARW